MPDTMSSAQWSREVGNLKLWTMEGTDTDVRRVLSRQRSSFEDERAELVRQLRDSEAALDGERVALAQAGAEIEKLRRTVEALQQKGGGEEEEEEEEIGDEDLEDEDEEEEVNEEELAEEEEDAGGGGGGGEEVEYYRGQLVEAEQRTEALEEELAGLHEGTSREMAALREQLESLLQERSSLLRSRELENKRLQQDIRNKEAALAAVKADFQSITARYEQLQARLTPSTAEPESAAVRSTAAALSKATARRMRGEYDKDYAVLYDLIYDYEKRVTALTNEALSLRTIVDMREQDVAGELSERFDREKNELLGRINALEIQLRGGR